MRPRLTAALPLRALLPVAVLVFVRVTATPQLPGMAALAAAGNPDGSPPSPHRRRRRHVAADGSVREFNPETRAWELLPPIEDSATTAAAAGTPLLAIEGRRFEFDFARGGFRVGGKPVVVVPPAATRSSEAQQDGDTGRTVWDAAVVVAKYLDNLPAGQGQEHGHRNLAGKRVLELGAGTGLAGLAAAVLGAQTVITDLPYCLDSIRANAAATGVVPPGSVTVRELDWLKPAFAEGETYDLVLGADIVWLDHLVAPLCQLFERILELNPRVQLLLSHQTRSQQTDDVFFERLGHRFLVARVDPSELPEGFRESKVNLFRAVGRQASAATDL